MKISYFPGREIGFSFLLVCLLAFVAEGTSFAYLLNEWTFLAGWITLAALGVASLEADLNKAREQIEVNLKTLQLARKSLIRKDAYGLADASAWNNEISKYLAKIDPENTLKKRARVLLSDYINQKLDELDRIKPLPLRETYCDDMEGLAFEEHCADILRKNGWTAIVTTGQDNGLDVYAEKDGLTVAIQCKRSSSPIGNGAIQEALTARELKDADVGAVVSNATFTRNARDLAAMLDIALLRPSDLPNLQDKLTDQESV